jgi:hypothetical protein
MKTKSPNPFGRVVPVRISTRVESVVIKIKQETGMTQVAFLERLLEWFAAQDPRIRTAILNPHPQVREGLARLVMEEMQANPSKDFDAMPRFDALIDHDFTSGSETQE